MRAAHYLPSLARLHPFRNLLTELIDGAKLHAAMRADPILLPHCDKVNRLGAELRFAQLPRKGLLDPLQHLLLGKGWVVVDLAVLDGKVYLGADDVDPDFGKLDRLEEVEVVLEQSARSRHEHGVEVFEAHVPKVGLRRELGRALAWQVPDADLVTKAGQHVWRGGTRPVALETGSGPWLVARLDLCVEVLEDSPDQGAFAGPGVPEDAHVHEAVFLGILLQVVAHPGHEGLHVLRNGVLPVQLLPPLQPLSVHPFAFLLARLLHFLLRGQTFLLELARCRLRLCDTACLLLLEAPCCRRLFLASALLSRRSLPPLLL
mmetsp:Transcript_121124/g.338052  ORF Transcript_121124/g.338052 Transcript_121124/m.338052 type:complete len:318 (-) Transcript_121124:381-1334(-)